MEIGSILKESDRKWALPVSLLFGAIGVYASLVTAGVLDGPRRFEVQKPPVEIGQLEEPDDAQAGRDPRQGEQYADIAGGDRGGAVESLPKRIPAGIEVGTDVLDAARLRGKWITQGDGSLRFVPTAEVESYRRPGGWLLVGVDRVEWFPDGIQVSDDGQTSVPVGREMLLRERLEQLESTIRKLHERSGGGG